MAGAQEGEVLNGTNVVSKLCMLAAFGLTFQTCVHNDSNTDSDKTSFELIVCMLLYSKADGC